VGRRGKECRSQKIVSCSYWPGRLECLAKFRLPTQLVIRIEMKSISSRFSLILAGSLAFSVFELSAQQSPRQLIQASGVKGGLIVHLGSGDGNRTAGLRLSNSYMVQGWDRNAANIAKARLNLRAKSIYGPVSVDRLDGKVLPYIDNFANLVVADDTLGVPMDEIKRVLAPRGVAMVTKNGKTTKWVKPVPSEIDDWTHYFHNPSGNAVAQDSKVGPPRHMQWVGSPRWSRHHDRMASMSALVSAAGRLFYIMDEGSRVSIQLPSHWKLIARDAFNGTVLWRRDIPKWHHQLWPLKSGPTQLARRLVATDDQIFATLELDGPVHGIDATSGKTLREFAGTEKTEEILHVDGTVFVLTRDGGWELGDYLPKHNVGDQARVRTEFVWNARPRKLLAFNAKTGKRLWELKDKITPLSVAIAGGTVAYYNGDQVVSVNQKTGKENWKAQKASRRSLIPFNFAPRLVIYQDVVLFAGGEGKMQSFDLASGKQLWEQKHDPSGYQSPQDLLVVGGLVWSASITSGRGEGVYTGFDPRSGEIKKQFPPNVETYWFHHRCYLAKATENFLMPSRTGIEFIDHEKEHWDINHWVRGGCLYGVMPANGLTYAPPHNCACYPEAKLFGFNALAPASSKPLITSKGNGGQRFEKGPAFGKAIPAAAAKKSDWPTFRHDSLRSGYSGENLPEDMSRSWQNNLGGRLSALTIAGGGVYVAQIDQHTVHGLDEKSGKVLWSYTAGGRVDSPPTYWDGRVVFGSADGWVYCLRAKDGELIWRFRGAPTDQRVMAFEQVESVWPVHGSVLVERGVATFVAGRSTFLDGGLRLIKLNAATGKKLLEKTWDNIDPATGKDIQDRLETLQMQVGLPDILCSDGKYTYLRSQKIDETGTRLEIGPVSGSAAAQGAAQKGEGAHLFAPMGYLDDTYFHRAYWVYGKNFAGGHNGYYQAGKYAPAGRMMVFNETNVFGFGRDPKYLRWTTTIEHQLFSAPRQIPDAPAPSAGRGKKPAGSNVTFGTPKGLNPTKKAVSVEAWVFPDKGAGVVFAHGGPLNGFALTLTKSQPAFIVRSDSYVNRLTSKRRLKNEWNHVAVVLGDDLSMRMYLNGELIAEGKSEGPVTSEPKQGFDLGMDTGSSVGNYKPGFNFTGLIDEVRVYHRELTEDEIALSVKNPEQARSRSKDAVLACTFDNGNAKDMSGKKHNGTLNGVDFGKGKVGTALWFRKTGGGNSKQSDSYVERDWNRAVPMFAQAMAMANDTVFVAGAPDVMDEEYTFERIMEGDKSVQPILNEQDRALQGKQGSVLWGVSVKDGRKRSGLSLGALPVWDGMAVANGGLFVATKDGKVTRFGK
jgi:outer membrane protein assembly factor BamB